MTGQKAKAEAGRKILKTALAKMSKQFFCSYERQALKCIEAHLATHPEDMGRALQTVYWLGHWGPLHSLRGAFHNALVLGGARKENERRKP